MSYKNGLFLRRRTTTHSVDGTGTSLRGETWAIALVFIYATSRTGVCRMHNGYVIGVMPQQAVYVTTTTSRNRLEGAIDPSQGQARF